MNHFILPDWVQYIATDKNSRTFGYELEPELVAGFEQWIAKDDSKFILIDDNFGVIKKNLPDWKNSLIKIEVVNGCD